MLKYINETETEAMNDYDITAHYCSVYGEPEDAKGLPAEMITSLYNRIHLLDKALTEIYIEKTVIGSLLDAYKAEEPE